MFSGHGVDGKSERCRTAKQCRARDVPTPIVFLALNSEAQVKGL